MCRLLAYLGPPVDLEDLLWGPPHSLVAQSWAPRHQRQGTVNGDGFGVGWYDHALRPEPARWRTPRPAWSERSFRSVAGLVRTSAVLAAVRDATPPLPVEESGTPPFTDGHWLFAHNGAVAGYGSGNGLSGVQLRRLVSDPRAASIEGASDSEVLFALTLDRLDAGATMPAALAQVVAAVGEVVGFDPPPGPEPGTEPAPEPGTRLPTRLNLVVTDGRRLAATACGDSLFVLDAGGSVVVASEPYDDDPRWSPVPDGSVVDADASGAEVRPLNPGSTR